jgi:hypothetical protein
VASVVFHHRQPVGEELTLQGTDIVSATTRVITLERVIENGTGIAAHAQIVGAMVGPFPGTYVDQPATPDGTYRTYPPAATYRGVCRTQRLLKVEGYKVAPRSEFALDFLIRFTHPGAIKWNSTTVYYRVGTRSFKQTMTYGYVFTVTTTGSGYPVPVAPYERPCLRMTHLLPD